ncbi:hypothetical protein PHISCL_08417 [Aspergillus sclerotialis]|uniref:Uncharacterized protein n=1 Tax=Aspergillus sclerotialis TaxID=2070753 RepID=A0A3A2Z9H2_9EURO|nr:hypothetical protein PHISCL_08417 [Aspergillus sclerotialis]
MAARHQQVANRPVFSVTSICGMALQVLERTYETLEGSSDKMTAEEVQTAEGEPLSEGGGCDRIA